jgi:hypothetical protein
MTVKAVHLALQVDGSQPTMLLLADRSDVMKEEVDAGEMEECVIIHQLQLQLLCF